MSKPMHNQHVRLKAQSKKQNQKSQFFTGQLSVRLTEDTVRSSERAWTEESKSIDYKYQQADAWVLDADSKSTSIGSNLQTALDRKYLSLLSLELFDILLFWFWPAWTCEYISRKTSINAKHGTSMEGRTESIYKSMNETMNESMIWLGFHFDLILIWFDLIGLTSFDFDLIGLDLI